MHKLYDKNTNSHDMKNTSSVNKNLSTHHGKKDN